MIKISVIIPVYNVEKYLTRCLSSLVKQTFEEYELIIVNDGSTDNSQSIINIFLDKYPRLIKSYSKVNGGLSDARNFGLLKAVGRYVAFIDSDDFVEPEFLSKMYEKASNENADIVVCAYKILIQQDNYFQTKQIGDMDNFSKSLQQSPELIVCNTPYAWNKLYLKSLFIDNHIEFPLNHLFEDIATTYKLFLKANKISKVNEPLINYLKDRDDSIINSVNVNTLQMIDSLEININYFKENKVFDYYSPYLCFLSVRHIFYRFREFFFIEDLSYIQKFYDASIEHLATHFPDWRYNPYVVSFFSLRPNRKDRAKKLLLGDSQDLQSLLSSKKSKLYSISKKKEQLKKRAKIKIKKLLKK